jgi:hypothetical protein
MDRGVTDEDIERLAVAVGFLAGDDITRGISGP